MGCPRMAPRQIADFAPAFIVITFHHEGACPKCHLDATTDVHYHHRCFDAVLECYLGVPDEDMYRLSVCTSPPRTALDYTRILELSLESARPLTVTGSGLARLLRPAPELRNSVLSHLTPCLKLIVLGKTPRVLSQIRHLNAPAACRRHDVCAAAGPALPYDDKVPGKRLCLPYW
jgi:hypothetical protein